MATAGRGRNLTSAFMATEKSEAVTSRKHRPDYQIVLFMGLLMLLGLIIIYAIGPQRANILNNAYGGKYSDTYFFIKQIISLSLALSAFTFFALLPLRFVKKYAGYALIFAIFLCSLLAVSGWLDLGIAQKSLGATRWFNLGSFGGFQPSEVLKFAVLLYLAYFLGAKAKLGKVNDFNETIVPIIVITAISMLFIVIIQKDMGTGVSMIGIIAAMLFMAGLSKKNIAISIVLALVFGSIFILSEGHRIDRVTTFLQGDSASISDDGGNYHIEHAKIAIGTGGLFGVGIGNSVQATGYLPEAINDSVFAIMGETFGLVGLTTILALFSALLLRLLKVADHLIDISLKLIVVGVFGWLGTHVILNIASMIGVFPLTGITLPLLSSGGTSMMFIAGALGLAFQLSGLTVHTSKLKEVGYHENSNGRRGIGRSRHASRSGNPRS